MKILNTLIILVFMTGPCLAGPADLPDVRAQQKAREAADELEKMKRQLRDLESAQGTTSTPQNTSPSVGNPTGSTLNSGPRSEEEQAVDIEQKRESLKVYKKAAKRRGGSGATMSAADQAKQSGGASGPLMGSRLPAKTPTLSAQEQAEKAFNQGVEKSRKDVTRCYPQTLDANHPIHAKATELFAQMESQENPIIHDADAPFIVYSMAAAMLGVKPIMPR